MLQAKLSQAKGSSSPSQARGTRLTALGLSNRGKTGKKGKIVFRADLRQESGEEEVQKMELAGRCGRERKERRGHSRRGHLLGEVVFL